METEGNDKYSAGLAAAIQRFRLRRIGSGAALLNIIMNYVERGGVE